MFDKMASQSLSAASLESSVVFQIERGSERSRAGSGEVGIGVRRDGLGRSWSEREISAEEAVREVVEKSEEQSELEKVPSRTFGREGVSASSSADKYSPIRDNPMRFIPMSVSVAASGWETSAVNSSAFE
jgi:hypothetical protein